MKPPPYTLAQQAEIRSAVLGRWWRRNGEQHARQCVEVTFYDGDFARAWFDHATRRGTTGCKIVRYARTGWRPDNHQRAIPVVLAGDSLDSDSADL